MRRSILSILAVFCFLTLLHSQSITPYTINSTGGSFKPDESTDGAFKSDDKKIFLDWSVGEMTLVNTLRGPGFVKIYILTNGLLQPTMKKEGEGEEDKNDKKIEFTTGDIKVFPNPANSYVQVNFLMKETGKIRLTLFNTMGQQVYTKEVNNYGHHTIERISMSGYTQGTYLLFIEMGPPGIRMKRWSYKIVKAN